jgi:hypothetical protein
MRGVVAQDFSPARPALAAGSILPDDPAQRFILIRMMDVEIELRIPTLTIKLDEDKTQRIDNSLVRFRKVIQVPAFPPPGSKIALSIGSDMAFECEIGRADWHEEKQKFVLACKYPKQRIFPHEYDALVNDPQWERTEFPA